jgi:hypothetical protein
LSQQQEIAQEEVEEEEEDTPEEETIIEGKMMQMRDVIGDFESNFRAKNEGRDPTPTEASEVASIIKEYKALNKELKKLRKDRVYYQVLAERDRRRSEQIETAATAAAAAVDAAAAAAAAKPFEVSIDVAKGQSVGMYGARFSTAMDTRGCHWFPRLLV